MAAYQFLVISWCGLTMDLLAWVDVTCRDNIWPLGFGPWVRPHRWYFIIFVTVVGLSVRIVRLSHSARRLLRSNPGNLGCLNYSYIHRYQWDRFVFRNISFRWHEVSSWRGLVLIFVRVQSPFQRDSMWHSGDFDLCSGVTLAHLNLWWWLSKSSFQRCFPYFIPNLTLISVWTDRPLSLLWKGLMQPVLM